MTYNVAKIFYSIQGEGYWAGTPMAFIRLSGCNLSCDFCDTDHETAKVLDEHQIAKALQDLVTSVTVDFIERVVITGGEPLIYDLKPLITVLKNQNWILHLETNGTIKRSMYSMFDWVAVCPKSAVVTRELASIKPIDEIKVLCGLEDWETIAKLINDRSADKLIMPLAGAYKDRKLTSNEGINKNNTSQAINYVLKHPRFKFCPQLHKLCGFL